MLPKPDGLSLIPGRREPAPTRCTLSSTCRVWRCVHTRTHKKTIHGCVVFFPLGPQLVFPDFSLFRSVSLTSVACRALPWRAALGLLSLFAWLALFLLPVEPPPTCGVVRSAHLVTRLCDNPTLTYTHLRGQLPMQPLYSALPMGDRFSLYPLMSPLK